MPDYKLRSKILIENDSNDILKIVSKNELNYYYLHFNKPVNLYYKIQSNNIDPIKYNECVKLNESIYKQKIRLKKRISSLITNNFCYFITLTFKDSILTNSDEVKRRNIITRWLKSFTDEYIGNIDFSKTNREHYHVIVKNKPDKYDLSLYHTKYGMCKSIPIINKNSSSLANYIIKLTNHCLKIKGKRQHLLYSKNKTI